MFFQHPDPKIVTKNTTIPIHDFPLCAIFFYTANTCFVFSIAKFYDINPRLMGKLHDFFTYLLCADLLPQRSGLQFLCVLNTFNF